MSRPLKTILIATSLTDASDAVVRIGRALARATGASPWLVHAYFPYLPLILARIAERRADLAVLGTHGRGGFERLVIGSVAAELLHSASCNLLVIPPAASQWHDAAMERTEEPAGADWGYVSDEAPVAAGRS